MFVFKASSSTEMAREVYSALAKHHVSDDSRNGPVIKFPDPVAMCFTNPLNRCNFTPGRDANPVFHHMEALWMLAGRRDVAFLEYFNKNIIEYSDDGKVFNAAYGYRARREFGLDQLQEVIKNLSSNPETRQAVIQLWNPADLVLDTKDKACNMSMVFSISDQGLRLTVFNRSNDAIYGGVTGANPVHFSYFLEYVAEQLRLPVHDMWFISNNLHVYTELYDHWGKMSWHFNPRPPHPTPLPIGELSQIEHFCSVVEQGGEVYGRYDSPMLKHLSAPMYMFWVARKHGESLAVQLDYLNGIKSKDWKQAIVEWVHRREKK